ncbi:winged helix-turn-helix domain-containing protein [Streptomyces turgidiscabies]|uniref:Transcriptional regulatory protein, C-terminal domain protein n=1 Tax=Streptomyces turgidiscabies (strain Car8) TaxID=698760 RepID=L7ESM2_STRT8|nr:MULTISPECIES: winged helix-turn-helix domain-containing protein [Streptomyces]ELP62002.1 transcriptional regulatory protein, C-terminal domain protein [Streptomyces turgidiscabies Car8]MDX3499932.1 winged helix-turn-helix domain-containing protein [Streptomyces turgidiscabies]GAQ76971.1 alkaline phosphatase synthesis transcriptional [Streptomyces turgidiscabies]
MATTRTLSPLAPLSPLSAGGSARHRLRAVDRDEVVDVRDFLPPGATWLPAPPHTLPTLPGRPPMIGYLVLVPADQQPPVLPFALPDPELVPAPAQSPADGGRTLVRVADVQRTAEVDGRPLDLTYLEFELLAHLVAHPGRVHTRDQLVTTVWGYGHVGDGRTVDVHIARLRRKLGAEHRQAIQTVRRVGYKYTPPTAR